VPNREQSAPPSTSHRTALWKTAGDRESLLIYFTRLADDAALRAGETGRQMLNALCRSAGRKPRVIWKRETFPV
jgi:hypothetical protein